ncbi:MAG: hypothetical protein JXA10_16005 [Anaerolineae bacterium]|nr:hypothetical protein [Anaerolineae bacterium]
MLTFLLFVFSMTIALSIILGWSIFVGWLLTLIFPFELFEGTLLAMLASVFSVYALNYPPGESGAPDWSLIDDEDDEFPEDQIPMSKFVKTEDQKTWENLSRYEIANAIVTEFKASIKIGQMTDAQLEALAIRMADAGIELLKQKPARTTNVTITANQLKNQLRRMGFKPDADDILKAATHGINFALYETPIELVVKQKMWDQRAPIVVDLDYTTTASDEDTDLG